MSAGSIISAWWSTTSTPCSQRAREKFPQANIVKRPSTRPFANYSAHDPDGNVFDLAQKDEGDKLVGVYAEQSAAGWSQDRYLAKFAIRTMNPEKCADFYQYVFELKPVNREAAAPPAIT